MSGDDSRTRLTVTRRVGERIHIGDNVEVEVVEVSGHTVRIAVTAPRSTSIHRHEHLAPGAER